MKLKSTRRALLVSGVFMLLSLCMLVGSTFAWFADGVKTNNNIVKSGNLEVMLEYSTDGEQWSEILDDTALFHEQILWEPGHTEIVYLRVTNKGDLAVRYTLRTRITDQLDGTNVYGLPFRLSDYLNCGVVETMDTEEMDMKAAVTATAEKLSITDVSGICGVEGLKTDGQIQLQQEASAEMALIVTMPITVGNEANYQAGTEAPWVRFGIELYASQEICEADSFDDQYDADAYMETDPP